MTMPTKDQVLISIEPMKSSDIEEVALLTAQCYHDNPLVKKGFISPETVRKNEITALTMLLQAQQAINQRLNRTTVFNFVCRSNGKIILAFSSCQYHYYVRNLLEKLEKQIYVKNIQQEFKENPLKEGEVVYEKRLVINKEFMSKGFGVKFLSDLSLYFTGQGYFYGYTFASNPKGYSIYKKMGGTIIREILYEVDGKQTSMRFCFREIHRMAKSRFIHL